MGARATAGSYTVWPVWPPYFWRWKDAEVAAQPEDMHDMFIAGHTGGLRYEGALYSDYQGHDSKLTTRRLHDPAGCIWTLGQRALGPQRFGPTAKLAHGVMVT